MLQQIAVLKPSCSTCSLIEQTWLRRAVRGLGALSLAPSTTSAQTRPCVVQLLSWRRQIAHECELCTKTTHTHKRLVNNCLSSLFYV
jgi:hypothetical protein